MQDFWDSKARENAMYYASSYRAYDDQDADEFWKWGRILAERFLEESGIQFTGEESILEIGCGIGRMTLYFAERFREVHGVDVPPEMLTQAKDNLKEFPNVALHLGNGHDLSDFADLSFDFVFSYITFQHIPDAAITSRYIEETGRVLREGGQFYFQVNNLPSDLRTKLGLGSKYRSLLRRLRLRGARTAGSAVNGPKDLDHPAWRGTRVSVGQVRRACQLGKLKVLSLDGEGTQYLWVRALKQTQ